MVDASVAHEDLLEKVRTGSQPRTGASPLSRTLEQQLCEREKYHRMLLELYPDWKSGILSQQEYLDLKADLNSKLQTLDHSIQKLRDTAGGSAVDADQENAFLSHFRKYRNFTELTRPMLTELVQEIRIYEGGRLEIILRFQDALKALASEPVCNA